jgi:hypothetical protein
VAPARVEGDEGVVGVGSRLARYLACATVVMALAWPLGGCTGGAVVTGSGKTTTKSYDLKEFTEIDVGDAFDVSIEQKDAYGVSVTVDDNLAEYLEIDISGETLRVGLKPGNYLRTNLRATVTLPELKALKLSGSSHGSVKGFKSDSPFNLIASGSSSADINGTFGEIEARLSGSSTLDGTIKTKDGAFYLEGSSKAVLDGTGGDMSIDCEGSSDANLESFPVGSATVKLDGSSKASIELDGRLDANLNGSSVLTYAGDPTLGTINTSGGSELKQLSK